MLGVSPSCSHEQLLSIAGLRQQDSEHNISGTTVLSMLPACTAPFGGGGQYVDKGN